MSSGAVWAWRWNDLLARASRALAAGPTRQAVAPPPPIVRLREGAELRPAAVLILLQQRAGADGRPVPHVLFTRRPSHLRHHASQISFVGGKFDAQRDRSLWEAATREAEEEIGVPGAAVEWVGALPQSFPSSSSFLVAAFVGAIAPKLRFSLDPNEVERVIFAPVHRLLDPQFAETRGMYRDERGRLYQGPLFHVEEELAVVGGGTELRPAVVWGLSAYILRAFLEELARSAP